MKFLLFMALAAAAVLIAAIVLLSLGILGVILWWLFKAALFIGAIAFLIWVLKTVYKTLS